MKTIILFIENYVPGGNDQIALDLINHLKYKKLYLFINKRHDLRLFNAHPLSSKVEIILYPLITLAEINSLVKSYKDKHYILYCLLAIFALLLRYPWIIFSTMYFFNKFRKIHFDLFISNNGGYPGGEANRSATVAASFIKKTKNYHIVHNLAPKPPFYFKIFEMLYDTILDKRTIFICVSNQTKEHLLRNRFIKQIPFVIQNGVRLPDLNNKKATKIRKLKLLNVANLDSRKNHLLALKALTILKNQGVSNIELYILGKESEAGYLENLKEYIKQNDLSAWVKFEGFINPKPYYEECHVFLLTSIIESFALVRVEAMSYKMPVITTDVGDAKEQVVDSVNGYIISDENDLANAILSYRNDPTLIEQHGIMSEKIFREKFTLAKMIHNYVKIFRN